MSFGIIAESIHSNTGYSQNSLQSLRHPRSRHAVTRCLRKIPASHPEAVFNGDNNNNNNNNNNNTVQCTVAIIMSYKIYLNQQNSTTQALFGIQDSLY